MDKGGPDPRRFVNVPCSALTSSESPTPDLILNNPSLKTILQISTCTCGFVQMSGLGDALLQS